MQDEYIILVIFLAPIAVLQIILFFKVWGMTTNTKKIRAFLEKQRPDLYWHDMGQRYKEEKKED